MALPVANWTSEAECSDKQMTIKIDSRMVSLIDRLAKVRSIAEGTDITRTHIVREAVYAYMDGATQEIERTLAELSGSQTAQT